MKRRGIINIKKKKNIEQKKIKERKNKKITKVTKKQTNETINQDEKRAESIIF